MSKNNLIIHRLVETQDNEKDQAEKDKADVIKIIEITNPRLKGQLEILTKNDQWIKRLGNKKPDARRPRPIKVILPDEEMKKRIFQGCRNLKNSPFKQISIIEDQTREEQEEKLRRALAQREEADRMAQAQERHFPNTLPDYKPGTEIKLSVEEKWIIPRIESIVKTVLSYHDAKKLQKQRRKHQLTAEGGLYVGQTGISFMLWHVATHTANLSREKKQEYFTCAKTLWEEDDNFYDVNSSGSEDASFILGVAGHYFVGALLARAYREEQGVANNAKKYRNLAARWVLQPSFNEAGGGNELFVGRAGYLCGAFNFEEKLGVKVIDEATKCSICSLMYKQGKEGQRSFRSPSPLMYAYYDCKYLGAAHGISSIVQMMLGVPSFLEANPEAESDLRGCVDLLLNYQAPDGNFAPTEEDVKPQQSPSQELVHWCHGAPGVIYMLAKAYCVLDELTYLTACVRCGDLVWAKGLLRKGPGLCHGVAGNGYTFLLLYRMTGEDKHLHRALQFAKFLDDPIFRTYARVPDAPASLFEGWAGAAVYLTDLLQPNEAEFPFFNVL